MKNAKSKISAIQKHFESTYKLDTDAAWDSVATGWDEKFGASFTALAALGSYSEKLSGMCRLQNITLS